MSVFTNKAPWFSLSKEEFCEAAGCNIKAWSIPLTYKISLTTNKQAERMGSVWLTGGRGREKEVELCRRSFARLYPPSLSGHGTLKWGRGILHSLNCCRLSVPSAHAARHVRPLSVPRSFTAVMFPTQMCCYAKRDHRKRCLNTCIQLWHLQQKHPNPPKGSRWITALPPQSFTSSLRRQTNVYLHTLTLMFLCLLDQKPHKN